MMTTLEKILAHDEWTQYRNESWTTVRNGIGFALYQKEGGMWLCGYSPKVVRERMRVQGDKAPYITLYDKPWNESMFDIPASSDFVSTVIIKHFPELRP